jgi:hypothetical protein
MYRDDVLEEVDRRDEQCFCWGRQKEGGVRMVLLTSRLGLTGNEIEQEEMNCIRRALLGIF